MPKPENVTPHKYKKRQSGNPKGRPKKLPEIEVLLADVFGQPDAMKAVLEKLQTMAKAGNIRAIEIILDRSYGKPKQNIDHTSGGEQIVFTGFEFLQNIAAQDDNSADAKT